MLRYHVAFFLPHAPGGMVVAEALDFPGAVSQGFDLPDARLMIASAMEDLAQLLLEEGKPLPTPAADATSSDADLIELVPLSVRQSPDENQSGMISAFAHAVLRWVPQRDQSPAARSRPRPENRGPDVISVQVQLVPVLALPS